VPFTEHEARHREREDRLMPRRPNIIMVVLDDCGFAQLGCFGSEMETPHVDALAADGLRFNSYHVTALCSPTRSCLLTGRNHHAVGMGLFPEVPGASPGYSGRLPDGVRTLPGALRDSGYSTFAVGKWHITPLGERSAAGPFTRWPLGLGFEGYYGFLGAEANQWSPTLVADNHPIPAPANVGDGYHLAEDLAEQAMKMVRDQHQASPERPFFLYFAPAAPHAPHHVAPEWSGRYRGRFDDGWEAMRDRVFARQQELGVVPADTSLTPRPSWVRPWGQLSSEERALYARMHEVYAGVMSHVDAQIGRIVEAVSELGLGDDTIIMVMSDNGASAEGGPHGTLNEYAFTLGSDETVSGMFEQREQLGGNRFYNHYAWGWAWAGNTPFRLWKRYTWLGGTRTPLVVRWPNGIPDAGEVRPQFTHAVDMMPTLLELAGVETGGQQLDGKSLAPAFVDGRSEQPRTQYFEILGSRSVYRDGWKVTTDHVISGAGAESELLEGSRDYDADRWSLFDLRNDFSESTDVSAERPALVESMIATWWEEAERNHVLPLVEGSFADMINAAKEADADGEPRTVYVYRPNTAPVHEDVGPNFAGGFSLTAEFGNGGDVPAGVICAQGDWNNGWALYVLDGRLHYALCRVGRLHLVSSRELEGPIVSLGMWYQPAPEDGTGGHVVLFANETTVGEQRIAARVPPLWQYGGSGLCIGYDEGLPVTDAYRPPFACAGALDRVVIEVRPSDDATARVPAEAVLRAD
jgi:arylsulfatase A-like enzyme